MDDTRIIYEYTIGLPLEYQKHPGLHNALKALDEQLTRLTGGLRRTSGQGTWASGAQHNNFTGTIEYNHTITYNLCIVPSEEERLKIQFEQTFSQVLRENNLPINHIHAMRMIASECIFALNDKKT